MNRLKPQKVIENLAASCVGCGTYYICRDVYKRMLIPGLGIYVIQTIVRDTYVYLQQKFM